MNVVNQQAFRDAVSCMGAAVDIITTDGPAGHAGFTANTVCNVTDMPPILLAYLNRGASVWPVFSKNQTLCVNTPSARQEPLSNLPDDKTPMEHRFVAAHWQTGVTGCLQLEEALVPFDYCISQVVSVGAHDILFCVIETIHHHATPYGLVWFDRGYRALMHPAC